MGSSKKKHKKHKDHERDGLSKHHHSHHHRHRDQLDGNAAQSPLVCQSIVGLNVTSNTHYTIGATTQTTEPIASLCASEPKQAPLRLVLKVPHSSYLSSTTNANNNDSSVYEAPQAQHLSHTGFGGNEISHSNYQTQSNQSLTSVLPSSPSVHSKKSKKAKKSKKSKHKSKHHHRHQRKDHDKHSPSSTHNQSIVDGIAQPTPPMQSFEWSVKSEQAIDFGWTESHADLLNQAQMKVEPMFEDSPEPMEVLPDSSLVSFLNASSPTALVCVPPKQEPKLEDTLLPSFSMDTTEWGFRKEGSFSMANESSAFAVGSCGSEIKLKLSKSHNSQYSSNLSSSVSTIDPKPAFTGGHHLQPPLSIISPPLVQSKLPLTQLTVSPARKTSPTSALLPTEEKALEPSETIHKNRQKNKEDVRDLKLLLGNLLKQLIRRDQQGFFAHPVSDSIAPGYSSIIAHPMDLSTIGRRIRDYRTLGDLMADVKLMCDNAMRYNRPDTVYYKAASRLWHYTKSKLFKKDALNGYAGFYTDCTPLELSLNPSGPLSTAVGHKVCGVGSATNTDKLSPFTPFQVTTSDLTFAPSFGSSAPSVFDISPNGTDAFDGTNCSTLSTGLASSFRSFTQTEPIESVIAQPQPQSSLSSTVQQSTSQQQTATLTVPALLKVKKDVVSDGMTADELVHSITESARKAKERLHRVRPNVVFTYVTSQENGTTTKPMQNECTLNTIVFDDHNTDNADQVEKRQITSRPFSLDTIYRSQTNHRINLNLMTNLKLVELFGNNSLMNTQTETSDENSQAEFNQSGQQSMVYRDESLSSLLKHLDSDHHRDNQLDHHCPTNDDPLRSELRPFYGDEPGLNYALSIAKFAHNNDYCTSLVSSLLGVLTQGQHKRVTDKFNRLLAKET